jgi:hypothetical protein
MEALFGEGDELGPAARPHTQALFSCIRAQHALRRGSDDVVPVLLESIRLLEETGNLRTAAVGRRDLGLLHLRRGAKARARYQLALAAERLVLLDTQASALALAGLATLERDDATRSALVQVAWSLADAPGGALSADERELVAGLVGQPSGALLERESAREEARRLLEG